MGEANGMASDGSAVLAIDQRLQMMLLISARCSD
jgi:hypothetical protein